MFEPSQQEVRRYEEHKRKQVLKHLGEKVWIADSKGKTLGKRVIRQNDQGYPYVKYKNQECLISEIINTVNPAVERPSVFLEIKGGYNNAS